MIFVTKTSDEQGNILYKPSASFIYIDKYQRIYHNGKNGEFKFIESLYGTVDIFKTKK